MRANRLDVATGKFTRRATSLLIPWNALENWQKGTILPFPQTVFDNALLRPEGGAAAVPIKLGKIGLRRAVVLNNLETELTEPASPPEQVESLKGAQPSGNERKGKMKATFDWVLCLPSV